MALSPSVVGLLDGSLAVLLAVFAFGGWLLGQCRLARRRGTRSPLTEELLRVPATRCGSRPTRCRTTCSGATCSSSG